MHSLLWNIFGSPPTKIIAAACALHNCGIGFIAAARNPGASGKSPEPDDQGARFPPCRMILYDPHAAGDENMHLSLENFHLPVELVEQARQPSQNEILRACPWRS
jgi:hypothetical protein